MPSSTIAQSALLKWVNTFSLDLEVKSLADLADGLVLSKILEDIDPSFLFKKTTQANQIQSLVKGLTRYIQSECEGLDPLLTFPALKAISEHENPENLFELLTVFLMAAISGPDREKYVIAITNLDADVQGEIAKIIQVKQKEVENAVNSTYSTSHHDDPSSTNSDLELEFESRYSTMIAQKRGLEQEKERLLKQMADMTTRLGRLQANNDLLQDRLTAAEDGLSGLAKDDDSAKVIKHLESKIREQDELIANQEGQVEQDRMEKSRMRKEMDRLKSASELLLQLQDELKEIKYQNVELTKKANTVDRYKQKLEAVKDLQSENESLQSECQELEKRCADFEIMRQRNSSLEATHRQFQDILGKREMEIFEMSNQKKLLDEEKATLSKNVRVLEERINHDEGFIKELQDKIDGRPSLSSPMTPSFVATSLEDELMESENKGPRANLELSRLRAEVQILKGNAAAAQDNILLRSQLEEAEKMKEAVEAKYREKFDDHVVAEQRITAMINSDPEGTKAFSDLRTALQTATEKLAISEKKSNEMAAEFEQTKRELLEAKSDLSMIEKEDLDALEELKATQQSLSFSFENELTALKSRHKSMESDYELQKSQLIEALLSKDKLREMEAQNTKLLASHTDAKEGSDVLTDIEAAHKRIAFLTEEADRESLEFAEVMKRLDDEIQPGACRAVEATRTALIEEISVAELAAELAVLGSSSIEQLKNKERKILELQGSLQTLKSGGIDENKDTLETENINLKRENAMMTTSWYDLASRLQSNLVVFQRRADASKTFINRQRHAVNPTGRR